MQNDPEKAAELQNMASQILANEVASAESLKNLSYINGETPQTDESSEFFKALQSDESTAGQLIKASVLTSPLLTDFAEAKRAVRIADNDKARADSTKVLADSRISLTTILQDEVESDSETLNQVNQFIEEYAQLRDLPHEVQKSKDDVYYTVGLTVATIVLLVVGKYGFIQMFSTVLVGLFTLVTIVNVFGLQTVDAASTWRITLDNIREGLSFGVGNDWMEGLGVALATFGIIGVGAAELIAYPYWCMEQGYAKFTGPRDESEEWANRARGWMKVLQVDAWHPPEYTRLRR